MADPQSQSQSRPQSSTKEVTATSIARDLAKKCLDMLHTPARGGGSKRLPAGTVTTLVEERQAEFPRLTVKMVYGHIRRMKKNGNFADDNVNENEGEVDADDAENDDYAAENDDNNDNANNKDNDNEEDDDHAESTTKEVTATSIAKQLAKKCLDILNASENRRLPSGTITSLVEERQTEFPTLTVKMVYGHLRRMKEKIEWDTTICPTNTNNNDNEDKDDNQGEDEKSKKSQKSQPEYEIPAPPPMMPSSLPSTLLHSSTPLGHTLLSSKVKIQRRRCICSGIECRDLTNCYRSLNDVRGDFVKVPNLNTDRVIEIKEFKVDRIVFHMGMDPEDKMRICNLPEKERERTRRILELKSQSSQSHDDNNIQVSAETPMKKRKRDNNNEDGDEDDYEDASTTKNYNDDNGDSDVENNEDMEEKNETNDNDATTTKSKKKTKQAHKPTSSLREISYIALHHYHPQVLQEIVIQCGKKSVDAIPIAKIKEWGLYNNGYTDEDIFHGNYYGRKIRNKETDEGVMVPVPTYRNARDDYLHVVNRYRLEEVISSCRKKADDGNDESLVRPITLTEDGMDGDVQPIEKMPKLDNEEGLLKAVCLLADEREDLRKSVVELRERLAMWEERERRRVEGVAAAAAAETRGSKRTKKK